MIWHYRQKSEAAVISSVRSLTDADILFSNQHLIAIHKPHGVPFHDESDSPGIVSQLKQRFDGETITPLHRLDRVTSGLMLFARTHEALSEMSRLFREQCIEKYYLALSVRKPKKKQGSVIGDMKKVRNGDYMLLHCRENPAVTRLRVISGTQESGLPVVTLLKPETGKTHQLRVTMKSLGSPIIGDTRYRGQPADRVYLHAWVKRFKLFGQYYDLSSSCFEGELYDEVMVARIGGLHAQLSELAWPKGSFLLSRN